MATNKSLYLLVAAISFGASRPRSTMTSRLYREPHLAQLTSQPNEHLIDIDERSEDNEIDF